VLESEAHSALPKLSSAKLHQSGVHQTSDALEAKQSGDPHSLVGTALPEQLAGRGRILIWSLFSSLPSWSRPALHFLYSAHNTITRVVRRIALW